MVVSGQGPVHSVFIGTHGERTGFVFDYARRVKLRQSIPPFARDLIATGESRERKKRENRITDRALSQNCISSLSLFDFPSVSSIRAYAKNLHEEFIEPLSPSPSLFGTSTKPTKNNPPLPLRRFFTPALVSAFVAFRIRKRSQTGNSRPWPAVLREEDPPTDARHRHTNNAGDGKPQRQWTI